jgi:hypothetical protein
LTTDGSGLGVGVLGSGRSGFAAATYGNSSSGGFAGRPDRGLVQLHRSAAQQCSPGGDMAARRGDDLGSSTGGLQLLPRLLRLLPLFSSLWIAAHQKDPHGRRRSHREEGLGATCRGAPRVWRCGSGR